MCPGSVAGLGCVHGWHACSHHDCDGPGRRAWMSRFATSTFVERRLRRRARRRDGIRRLLTAAKIVARWTSIMVAVSASIAIAAGLAGFVPPASDPPLMLELVRVMTCTLSLTAFASVTFVVFAKPSVRDWGSSGRVGAVRQRGRQQRSARLSPGRRRRGHHRPRARHARVRGGRAELTVQHANGRHLGRHRPVHDHPRESRLSRAIDSAGARRR